MIVEKYKNLSLDSSVYAYEIGMNYIDVQFCDGSIYRYSYRSAGSFNVEQMKCYAQAGNGLCSFIQRKVRKLYEFRKN